MEEPELREILATVREFVRGVVETSEARERDSADALQPRQLSARGVQPPRDRDRVRRITSECLGLCLYELHLFQISSLAHGA